MKATYICHMGSDDLVVDAARASFGKTADRYEPEQNARLIRYLAKHDHWTPMAHPQITLLIECPIFVARQDFKHQVGFVRNERSRRYVDDEPEFFTPSEWRARPEGSVKQGSGEALDAEHEAYARDLYQDIQDSALQDYANLLRWGVAPEQARMILPQSMMTSYYTTGSLAAWARAYRQRIDSHAQREIQDLAQQWGDIIEPLFPVSWAALTGGEA